jgi:hypothetical protein
LKQFANLAFEMHQLLGADIQLSQPFKLTILLFVCCKTALMRNHSFARLEFPPLFICSFVCLFIHLQRKTTVGLKTWSGNEIIFIFFFLGNRNDVNLNETRNCIFRPKLRCHPCDFLLLKLRCHPCDFF